MAKTDEISFAATFGQLYRLLTPRRRRQFYRVLALMLLGAVAELILIASAVAFLALLGGNIEDQSLGPLGTFIKGGGPDLIGSVTPIFIVAVLVASAIRLLLAWSNQRFVLGVGHDLAVETQRRVLLQPYSFHIERSTSEIIASLDKIQVLVFGVLQQAMTTFVAAVMSLFIMALLVSIDPAAALTAFVLLGLSYLVVSRVTSARLAYNSEVVGTAYDQRIKMVQESLGGIRDLIIDQTQPAYLEEFRNVDRRFARAEAATMFIATSPRYVLEGAALTFVAILAIMLAERDGGLSRTLPVLGAIALGGLRLMPLLQQAFASWATMAANRSVIGQVLDLLSLPVPGERKVAASLPFRRTIQLNDLTYAYPTRPEPAVAGVSLEIAQGGHLALVGETGSGKSTLADLLMGLLEPQSGTIEIDGTRLGQANVGAWQRNIAHVSQTIFLADASIARNIAFSVPERDLDMGRVRRVAALAEIGDFVETLPDGFETRIGERGVRLSGGQRQRIAIARALYKDTPILVLDEATNALDPETEAKVLANLFAEPGRTILLIAHRPGPSANCRVVRLKDGRIAED